MKKLMIAVTAAALALPGAVWAGGDDDVEALKAKLAKAQKQAAIVAGEVKTFSNVLSLHPNIPKDFTVASGEYCFFGGWKGHHTHYSTDPAHTHEDVIDFVAAEQMIAAGMDVDGLPIYPGILGEMTSGQWYFMPAKDFEPHHGKTPPIDLVIRAVDLDS